MHFSALTKCMLNWVVEVPHWLKLGAHPVFSFSWAHHEAARDVPEAVLGRGQWAETPWLYLGLQQTYKGS